jgi:hypothetical protein
VSQRNGQDRSPSASHLLTPDARQPRRKHPQNRRHRVFVPFTPCLHTVPVDTSAADDMCVHHRRGAPFPLSASAEGWSFQVPDKLAGSTSYEFLVAGAGRIPWPGANQGSAGLSMCSLPPSGRYLAGRR